MLIVSLFICFLSFCLSIFLSSALCLSVSLFLTCVLNLFKELLLQSNPDNENKHLTPLKENYFIPSDKHFLAYNYFAYYCWSNPTIWPVKNRIGRGLVSHNHAGHVHNVSKYISCSSQNCIHENDWLLAAFLSADTFCNLHDWDILAAVEEGQKHQRNYQGLGYYCKCQWP